MEASRHEMVKSFFLQNVPSGGLFFIHPFQYMSSGKYYTSWYLAFSMEYRKMIGDNLNQ